MRRKVLYLAVSLWQYAHKKRPTVCILQSQTARTIHRDASRKPKHRARQSDESRKGQPGRRRINLAAAFLHAAACLAANLVDVRSLSYPEKRDMSRLCPAVILPERSPTGSARSESCIPSPYPKRSLLDRPAGYESAPRRSLRQLHWVLQIWVWWESRSDRSSICAIRSRLESLMAMLHVLNGLHSVSRRALFLRRLGCTLAGLAVVRFSPLMYEDRPFHLLDLLWRRLSPPGTVRRSVSRDTRLETWKGRRS